MADGSVETGFTMPSYNPNADPVGLVYNSAVADPHPVFQLLYQEQTQPSVFSAQLTLNGTASAPVYYSDAEISGIWNQIALQGDATGLSTGRYPWQITIVNASNNQTWATYSGNVNIVNRTSSPFGAGWGLDNVEQLVPASGGVMLVNPDGTSEWFAGSGGSFTSPAGDFSTLSLSNGVYTRTMPDGTKVNFNSSGLQTSIVDTDGNTTSFGYNGSNQLTTVTDMDGQVTTLTYNGSGQLAGIEDPALRTATLAYTGKQLTSITDPADNLWKYGYSTSNLLNTLTDPNKNTTTFTYEDSDLASGVAQDFFTSAILPGGATESVTPRQVLGLPEYNLGTSSGNPANPVGLGEYALYTDPNGHLWTTNLDWLGFGLDVADIDPLGDVAFTDRDVNGMPWMSADGLANRTRDFFDNLGNVTETVYPDDSHEQFQYNGFSEVTKYTDPTGYVTSYTYNGKGDLTQITDALGHVTTMGYNSQGFVTSIEDPLTHTTTFGYGTFNLLTTITNALGKITTFGYDSAGDVISSTDPLGYVSTFSYSPLGWLTGETLPDTGTLSSVYTFGYDAVGNLTSEQTPNGSSSYTYDALNRLKNYSDSLVGTYTYNYDAAGNLTSVTNPNNVSESFGYDNAGRSTTVTDPMGHTTTYGYNAAGELTSVEDPLTHVTSYGYTPLGQLSKVTDPQGGVTTYQYDAAGDLTSLTDPDGNQTTYGYNQLHQLTITTDPLGHSTTYAYNQGGLLTATTDRDGRTIDFGYDALNRLTSETWVGGNYTATYNYDADGNLTNASDPYSSYSYTYDRSGRVTQVDNSGTPGVPHVVLNYGYDASGDRTSLTDSLGGSIAYGYGPLQQLTSEGLSQGGTLEAQVTFGYDSLDRLTGVTRTGTSGSDTITTSYTYDNADRLTNILHKDTTKNVTLANYTYGYDQGNELTSYQDASSSLTYSYDKDGELTGASGTLNGSSYSVSYGYDANGNRNMTGYKTGTGNELTSDGTYNYTYDNEGNLTSQTTIATGYVTYYIYDYHNRLTEVKQEDNHGNVLNDEKFTYDVFGNRIGVSNNGVQQSWTVFDGATPYMDFNGSGSLTERYLTDPRGLNDFYARVSPSGTVNWYLTDMLGSVRQIVSSSGSVLDTLTYAPFGSLVSETNAANGDRFKFTGGAYDSITGLYQFDNCYYNPSTGRFLNEDPRGFGGGDANLYRYVDNQPTDVADPTGLMPNRADGISLDYFLQLVSIYEGQHRGESPDAILSGLVTYFKQSVGWKYIYSPQFGWLDISHFFTTAYFTSFGVPSSLVEFGGVAEEYWQALHGLWAWACRKDSDQHGEYHSGFTFEDLPSNRLGIIFARQWNHQGPLAVALRQFLSSRGFAGVPIASPVYTQLPPNETAWKQQDSYLFGPINRAII